MGQIERAMLDFCTKREMTISTLSMVRRLALKPGSGIEACHVSFGVWKAFYRRHRDAVRSSPFGSVMALVDRLEAEYSAQEARLAVEKMLENVKTNGAEETHGPH